MTEDKALYEQVPGWEQKPAGIVHNNVGDVAVDASDRVYVLSRSPDKCVLVYESDGTFIRSWGESDVTDFSHGIGVAADGTVYIVDRGDHAIRQFSQDGTLLKIIGTPGAPSNTGLDASLRYPVGQWTSIRRSGPPFNSPTNISFGPSGDFYVSDGYGNARIHQFTPDGELIRSWGEPGGEPGQFRNPHHVHVAPDGRVLVSDRENERVQVFSSEGEFIQAWGVQRPGATVVTHDGVAIVASLDWRPTQETFTRGVIAEYVPALLSFLDAETGECIRRSTYVVPHLVPGMFGVTAADGLAVDSKGNFYLSAVPESFWGPGMHVPATYPCLQKFRRLV